jgi:hypothetical protein
MEIVLQRINDNGTSTTGNISVDGLKFVTIEDPHREIKIPGITRIPAGEYEIKFRTKGRHHYSYLRKFPDFHKGMLELQDVPEFQFILIHIGNSAKDTEGCICIGTKIDGPDSISESTRAYIVFYQLVSKALLADEKVTIKIIDN